mgnify:FL=1
MKIDEFIKKVAELGLKVDKDILNKLDIYAKFLIEYNTHTNLTSITNLDDIYLKHFYDSLTITKVIDLNSYENLLDFGTGAGFPGMVLKIFFPNLNVTLLDSNNKKIKFLLELKEKLALDNLEIINARVESLCKDKLNYYDIVTARAVTNMPVLTELAMPLVRQDRYFIAMKGSNNEEIEKSLYAIQKMNGKIEEINNFLLSPSCGKRNIIKIKKIKSTSKDKIRPYEKIIKKPLIK